MHGLSSGENTSLSPASGIPRLLLLGGLIALAVIARLVPHPFNLTPVGAVALFSGATLTSRRLAFALPMLALLIGDVFVGFHILMPPVYACFLLNVALGRRIRQRTSFSSVTGMTLLGACVFFVVTNFASWIAFYEHSFSGLVQCYIMGLPYFRYTLIGDLVYGGLLFGALAMCEARFPVFRRPADQQMAMVS